MRRDGMQTIGLQARRAHQAGADEQLQHGVAHKGQRQRRHFVNVDFGFLCKQHIFYYLVQIIEFVLADLDRVLFLNALGDQLVQNTGITQLRLEILQALVVLDVRTGEDTLQPRASTVNSWSPVRSTVNGRVGWAFLSGRLYSAS